MTTIAEISDAREIMSRKILINRMSVENLKYQIEYSAASMKIQELSTTTAKEKIKLITQLNDVLEQQLNVFSEALQQETLDIYGYINELDVPSQEYKDAVAALSTYEEKMLHLLPKIQHIENTIPDTKLITNYKIKTKPVAPTASTCGTETLAFGVDPTNYPE